MADWGWKASDADRASAALAAFAPALRRTLGALGLSADADDILQETLLAAGRAGAPWSDAAHARQWLWRVALNRGLQELRRRRSRVRAERDYAAQNAGESVGGIEQAGVAERRRAVQLALVQLHADDQALLVLRYFEDWSVVAIAEMLELPEGTVKRRLHEARQDLAAALAPFRRDQS